MLFNRVTLLRTSEFEISVQTFLIWEIVLISWTLATGIFPYYYKYLSAYTYWWMGIVGTIALFLSALFHVMFRIIIWCKYDLPFEDITLFLFGSVTESDIKQGQTGKELMVAACSPLINVLIALIMHCILLIGQSRALPIEIMGVIEFVRMINIILVVINMLPILPLDGGRIVQVLLIRFLTNGEKVSRFLTSIATITGLMLMTAGILLSVKGNIHGGIWWVLFGLYFREGASLINRKYQIQDFLKKETAEDIMTRNPVCVASDISINNFVQHYLYNYHFKIFPVIKGNQIIHSVLFSRNAFDLPFEEWNNYTVGEIASLQLSEITVPVKADVFSVMAKMYETGQSRVLVIDSEQRLQGVIVLKDLLNYLTVKMKL